MRHIFLATAATLLVTGSASAADAPTTPDSWMSSPTRNVWHVCWLDPCDASAAPAPVVHLQLPSDTGQANGASQPSRPVAIEYSDGYLLRRKIHRYASFATLPLFAAEFALGQSMYNATPSDTSSKRGLHAAIGVGIIGLFGVNTVTGAWNLFGEGRKDPNGRTLRLIHGLLMMTADVGFVATTLSGPNSRSVRHALTYETDKVTHRNIAIASISIGSAGYLLMLFGHR